MSTLRIIIYVGCFSIFCLATMLAIKNCNTMRQHIVIETAIFRYNLSHRGNEIPHTVVESYTKTLYRVWDWGCSRIVDPETYSKIKPYIRKALR